MRDRKQIALELDNFQSRLKELEIRYEQYFAGVEKREPYRERQDLSRLIRRYNPQLITQTDLKFRYHGLTSRLASYSHYWDRILRLIDEGKYYRHLARAEKTRARPQPSAQPTAADEADRLHAELLRARQQCGLPGEAPDPQKIALFLAAQRVKLSEKIGDRPVEFLVAIDAGKPRIKVRLKQ
jgi:hypothetical protein